MATADVPERAVAERLRAKEEDVRRREREVRQRDASLRERQEELESAKASCDALMVELHNRESLVADVEKKHGGLRRREEEVATREIVLAEKDAALHKRLQQHSLAEQQLAHDRENHAKHIDDEETRLKQLDARLEQRGNDLSTAESKFATVRQQHSRKMADADDTLSRRERSVAEEERRLHQALRAQELKQLETDHQNEQASERLKAIKAEHVDLEARLREARWKDDRLSEMLAAANEQKAKLTAWERDVVAREATVEERETALSVREAEIELKLAEIAVRAEHVLAAERDVQDKREQAAIDRANLDAEKIAQDEQAEQLAARERDIVLTEEALNERVLAARGELDNMASRRKALRLGEHQLASKERALKNWIIELEYRQQAIEHRESHPRPYLAPQQTDRDRVLQLGTANGGVGGGGRPGTAASEVEAAGGQFNRALIAMDVAQLQRAYLGATRTKSRSSGDRPPSSTSKGNRPATIAAATRSMDVLQLDHSFADKTAAEELQKLEREFRDLTCGFAVMDDAERDERFTPAEIDDLIAIIEQEARSFDEHLFLKTLATESLPSLSVTASPADRVLVADIERWVAGRVAAVHERLRRSTSVRLELLSRGAALLRGRIPVHSERVKSLSTIRPASKELGRWRSSRLPSPMDSAKPQPKQGDRTLALSPPPTSARATDDGDDLTPTWGSAPSPSAPRESRSPSPGTDAATASPRAGAPATKVRTRLVDALPKELRKHYLGSAAGDDADDSHIPHHDASM